MRPDNLEKNQGGSMRLLIVLALLLVFGNSARSDDAYPNRPVTIIVPSAPGGQLDVLARILATAMRPALGQPVIIENVSGPSGVVKSVRAAPDGYTLAFGNNGSLVFTAIMLSSLKLDPLQDYSPISLVGSMPMILVVNKSSGPNNLAELLDTMRRNEDKVTFGAAAPGSTSHTASTLLIERTKLKASVVPYRGTGIALQDLMAGTIQVVNRCILDRDAVAARRIGQGAGRERRPSLAEHARRAYLCGSGFACVRHGGLDRGRRACRDAGKGRGKDQCCDFRCPDRSRRATKVWRDVGGDRAGDDDRARRHGEIPCEGKRGLAADLRGDRSRSEITEKAKSCRSLRSRPMRRQHPAR